MSGHGHHHHHDAGFDWEAMADKLEVDGTLVLPLVGSVVSDLEAAGLEPDGVTHVLDAGCGPGVVTCELARRFPSATVSGLDSSDELLARVRRRAAAEGLDGRVVTVVGDLEHDLPPLDPADLVWVSMVVHHVEDTAATLRRLGDALRPGGRLVLVEFGGDPRVLPDDDPLVAGGAWRRMEDAATATLAERLGHDMIGRDWPAELSDAGLEDVTDRVVTFRYDAPLDEVPRRWLVRHVRRGIEMSGEALEPGDADALVAFADAVEASERADPFVEAQRRVLTARRPG